MTRLASTIGLVWTLGAASLHAQVTTEPLSRAASRKLLIVDLSGVAARVTTDAGIQSARLDGQIAFRQTAGAGGLLTLTVESVNLTGSSVATRRGPSGRFSTTLARGAAGSQDARSSRLDLPVSLVLHYPLIDRIKGQIRLGNDQLAPHTEGMRGRITGRFTQPLRSGAAPPNGVHAGLRFQLSQVVVGAVRDIRFDLLSARVREVIAPCDSIGKQMLCVQPVFIRSGRRDAEPTGRALDTFIENAEQIWRKCCINFEVREPLYVEDADFKVITEDEEEGDLRAAQPGNDDCVEVYFASSWDPVDAHGGGVTYGSGTAEAYIITADNNLDQPVPSVNHLGHELGHAMTLCHPARGCVAPRVDGTAGTVMSASGFDADNPATQSQANCDNAANPLLQFVQVHCCARPEIH